MSTSKPVKLRHEHEVVLLRARIAELEAACHRVIGIGYCPQRHPAGQDFVSKAAIAEVFAVLDKETK